MPTCLGNVVSLSLICNENVSGPQTHSPLAAHIDEEMNKATTKKSNRFQGRRVPSQLLNFGAFLFCFLCFVFVCVCVELFIRFTEKSTAQPHGQFVPLQTDVSLG